MAPTGISGQFIIVTSDSIDELTTGRFSSPSVALSYMLAMSTAVYSIPDSRLGLSIISVT